MPQVNEFSWVSSSFVIFTLFYLTFITFSFLTVTDFKLKNSFVSSYHYSYLI